MVSRVVICLFLLFAGILCQELTLNGAWTDPRYGGNLYICVDENSHIWATYSEIGVYWGALLNPPRNGAIAAGRWYVGGDFDCSSGEWQANFGDDTNTTLSFTLQCDGQLSNQITVWNSTRINAKANDDECNVVYERTSAVGSWGNAQLKLEYFDICDGAEDDGEGSYEYSTGLEGYYWGRIHEHGQLVQGNFSNINTRDSLRNAGLGLFFARSSEEAVYLTWYGATIDAEDINNEGRHVAVRGIRRRDDTPRKCAYNRYVVIPVEPLSNDAALLGIGFFLIALLVLF